MPIEISLSRDLIELITEALDHGIEVVEHWEELIPLLISIEDGQKYRRKLLYFDEEEKSATPDESRLAGSVRSLPSNTSAYAVCVDGFITNADGEKSEAIIVFAGERGKGYGCIYARRYTRSTGEEPFSAFSEFRFLGKSKQFLASD